MRSTALRLTLPLLLLALCLTLNGCFVFVPAPPPVDTSDLDALPENSRLQKGLKAFLKTGAPLRDAGGMLVL
jgi:hypothetical protein